MFTMTNELSKRIIDLRESKNWTQTQLAEKMGLSKSTMSKIESGYRKITTDELKLLSEIFGVSTDYLLGITPPASSAQLNSLQRSRFSF
jgi:transcriptional regulator with XRE-family HTH domain